MLPIAPINGINRFWGGIVRKKRCGKIKDKIRIETYFSIILINLKIPLN